jgi:pimeloyl-ACP methyl ester carboxylesterase
VAIVLLAFATEATQAAVRYQRAGGATLGGADALAEVRGACEIGARHVWVEVEGRGDCVAFYPTEGLSGARQAVIYFEGDIPPSYRGDSRKLDDHLRSLQRSLAMLATAYRVPYVLVARPGTFGSTGDHADRRNVREFLVMREAVDAIRQRYDLHSVVLAGQSGGATVAAALLTLGLTHVGCATPASGGYDLPAMLDWHASLQGVIGIHREHPASLANSFNAMDRIGGVQRDAKRRIFIVGDKADRVSPFDQQKRFAERLKAEGHHAEVIEAKGAGPARHGLTFTSLKLAGLCASGATDDEIRRAVAR